MRTARIVFVTFAVAAATARADPEVVSSQEAPRPPIAHPEPAPVPQPAEPTAADASAGPRPGSESGRLDDDGEPPEPTSRVVERWLLFVPKVLFEALAWPGHELLYVDDRYHPLEWYQKYLYFDENRIQIEPTVVWATGLGFSAGAHATFLDVFGDRETAVLQATGGIEYRVGFLAAIDTGNRLGPVKLGVSGNFDRRPDEPFFGIGNEGDVSPTGEMIDAQTNPTAVATHFRYQEMRAEVGGDVRLPMRFHVAARGSIVDLDYTHSSEAPSIETVYTPQSIVGFDTHTNQVNGEVELRWDNRGRATPWEPASVHGTGTFALLLGGYVHPLDGRASFGHYTAELQQYIHLGYGPRVLAVRFHGEGVTGDVDNIPITELPMLGGGSFLRGYSYARFRDRIAAVGSLPYMWALGGFSAAFVFTDVVRVFRSWDDLGVDQLHVGFGVGLEVFTPRTFLMDLSVASSSDGGIAFLMEFSPMLDARTRWR